MKSWKLTLSFGCLILGILISLQFKEQAREGFPLPAYRPADLLRLVKGSEQEKQDLNRQIEQLRGRLAVFESPKTKQGLKTRTLAAELEQTRMEAGLIPVKGTGVEVILDDSKRRASSAEDNYFYLVHDVDLDQLVNELWAIGAEAVSVNGQRIVANSSIRCVGPTILVNTARLSPPYHVFAVGDSDTLAAGLKMRGGFLSAMAISISHGVQVNILKRKEVFIPAFGGSFSYHYAQPALKQ